MTQDNQRLLSLLGLARKASLVSFGHDAAKAALRSKQAKLCLLCRDASPRLQEEFQFLAGGAGVTLQHLALTSFDIKAATQYKAAVLTINNSGFAEKIVATLNPES